MTNDHPRQIEMIPIDRIRVINPRSRGKEKFKQIVTNISNLGLKKPVTVARRQTRNGDQQYDLVCGQGRLEAYKLLGQPEVPAFVIEASKQDLLLMSLAENLAPVLCHYLAEPQTSKCQAPEHTVDSACSAELSGSGTLTWQDVQYADADALGCPRRLDRSAATGGHCP